jgi:hypothetical protein
VALVASLITLWVLHRARVRDDAREVTDALVVPVVLGERDGAPGLPREVERPLTA